MINAEMYQDSSAHGQNCECLVIVHDSHDLALSGVLIYFIRNITCP